MTGSVFVDTNVLVYARDAGEPEKQPRAEEWMRHLWDSGRGRLSIQVLQEYYATVTRKLKPGLKAPAARRDVRSLRAWRPIPMEGPLLESAWGIEDRYRVAWWDALIVAAALAAGSGFLLSEDFRDGQNLADVEVVNPFLRRPAEVV